MRMQRTMSAAMSTAMAAAMAAALMVLAPAGSAKADAEGDAREILQATGVRGGLVVHLGCGDGRLTAALHASDAYLVHGLDTDAANVAKARAHVREQGLYGPVSVRRYDGRRLPYVDNLVNLVIAEDPANVTRGEILRVLRPGGLAYLKKNGDWERLAKPWPANIDHWTHWLHGPDNNAVALDEVIANPTSLQWIQPPLWLRSHNLNPGLSAMVSANGRLFLIMDESPPGVGGMPGQWTLVARDAFNGLTLWKQPIEEWGWKHWSATEYGLNMRFKKPLQLMRRLVAVGDRVFVTRGITAPVSLLEGATGEQIRTYAGTEKTFEIAHHGGALVLAVNHSLGTEEDPDITVMSVDVETGRIRWRSEGYKGISPKVDELRRYANVILTVGKDSVAFVNRADIVCLNLDDGSERWRVERQSLRPRGTKVKPRTVEKYRCDYFLPDLCTLVYSDGMLFYSQMRDTDSTFTPRLMKDAWLAAVDARTGKAAWSIDCCTFAHYTPPDIFVTNGLAWVLQGEKKAFVGVDVNSGEIKRSINADALMWSGGGHHRCFRNKATSNFIITCRRVTEFVDLDSGDIAEHKWIKGACGYGIMPANGLLYIPTHNCSCMMEGKFAGFLALSSGGKEDAQKGNALEKGPGYAAILADAPADANDWPTLRGNNQRSGCSASELPSRLEPAWTAALKGNLSALTVAGGKVFAADRDRHCVYCLDSGSGEVLWQFGADGRVDSPPTYYAGRILFGARDGKVYCVDAASGELVWRFHAAPTDRLVCAYGQIESAWPVHGSVLVENGKVYFASGRSTHVDGGIRLFSLDAKTGNVLAENRLGSKQFPLLADILVSHGDHLVMRDKAIRKADLKLVAGQGLKRHSGEGASFFVAYGGFLDDSLFNASCWSLDRNCSGSIISYDRDTAFVAASYKKVGASFLHDVFRPEHRQCRLRAVKRGKGKSASALWSVNIPIRAHALLASKSNLYLAGVLDKIGAQDPWGYLEGKKGGVLAVFSKADGSKVSELTLDAAPVFDGLAAAAGRLFLATTDGKVLCFKGK